MIKLSALIFLVLCLMSVPRAALAQGSGEAAVSSGHSCSHESANPTGPDPPPIPPGNPPVACTPQAAVCYSNPSSLGWCETGYICDNGCAYTCAPNPVPDTNYSISGGVCDDVNRDGVRNIGENGFPNVTINRTGPSSGSIATNPFGNYAFTSLTPGNYTISMVVPSGFIATSPTSRSATVPPDNTDVSFCIASSATLGSFTANAPTTFCSGTTSLISLNWSQSTNAERYYIYRDGFYIATNTGQANTTYTDTVPNNTAHSYFIEAERLGAPLVRAIWAAGWDTALPGNPANDGWSNPITSANCGGPLFSVSCTADRSTATVGQNVTWRADVTGGTSPYSYSWTGTDGLTSTTTNTASTFNQVSRSYSTPGVKTASVQATSGGQTDTATCSGAFGQVNVSGNASWIQTTGGDVHSDTRIDTPGGP